MKRTLLFLTLFLAPTMSYAEAPGRSAIEVLGDVKEAKARADEDVALADRTAKAMSEVVGVGLSPSLALAAFGMWDWYNGRRDVWYTSPWFTFPMLALLLLIVLKDVLGAPLGPLKQVADSGEVIANKISGSLGLIATVFYCADVMGDPTGQALAAMSDAIIPAAYAAEAAQASSGFWGTLGGAVSGIIGGACYFVVWLTGQAFTIMIFLNPFSIADPFLKAARASFLLVIVALCAYFPVVGIWLAALYILFAWLVAGYCLRLMGWGTVMSWDVLFKRGKGKLDDPKGILAFADSGMYGPPKRTLGRIIEGEGDTRVFSYRPWFILPRREHTFQTEGRHIIRGFLYPVMETEADGSGKGIVSLPPRYRGKEEELAAALGAAGVEDNRMLGGFKGFISWCKGLFKKKDKAEPSPA